MLGVGAGWHAEEYAALGWDFATRGRRMNEALEVLRACWTGRPGPFEGEFFTVPAGVLCFPTPSRPGGIALMVGGMKKVSLDRVARLGDGWVALTCWDTLDVGPRPRPFTTLQRSALTRCPSIPTGATSARLRK